MPLKQGKLMNNRNALVGFVACIKISFAEHFVVPTCARKTTIPYNLFIGNLFQHLFCYKDASLRSE